MSERTAVLAGALVGAMTGTFVAYFFFTERGRTLRERLEPTIDEVRHEFARFQRTIEKVGDMANDGMRAVNEFNAARSNAQFADDRTSH